MPRSRTNTRLVSVEPSVERPSVVDTLEELGVQLVKIHVLATIISNGFADKVDAATVADCILDALQVADALNERAQKTLLTEA